VTALIVVKLGGSVVGKEISQNLVDNIKEIFPKNKIVLVHGGGAEVTEVSEKLGKKQRFIVSPGGIRSRYTDLETVVIYTMVMVGKINKMIVSTLQKAGVNAIGLSGVDGMAIKAQRKKKLLIKDENGRKRIIEGGYTGKIQSVNSGLMNLLLENNYLPVFAPIALGEESELLNIDGDRAAAYIAGGINADKIIFITDVPGVLIDGQPIKRLEISEAKSLMPKIGFGMEKKILASTEALEMGAKESIISSGLIGNPITKAINHENGTVIKLE
jgi:acetylglutamate/LysW-gamma-L-alpha-aminoadipate kinase